MEPSKNLQINNSDQILVEHQMEVEKPQSSNNNLMDLSNEWLKKIENAKNNKKYMDYAYYKDIIRSRRKKHNKYFKRNITQVLLSKL